MRSPAQARPDGSVTDHERQFTARRFDAYLARRKIRRRFGAVGRPQAFARVDRFFRSMRSEFADAFFALTPLATIRRELARYTAWFNARRVHLGLGGRTPSAVYARRPPRTLHRFERGRRTAPGPLHLVRDHRPRCLPRMAYRNRAAERL
ncbi:MAG: transposase [Planctomycetes bacterium]|nr:transposase [Planctomycetota bacterium]